MLVLIAGSIIREMMAFGVPKERFWAVGIDPEAHTNFPKSQLHASQWVERFEDFLNDLYSQGTLTNE